MKKLHKLIYREFVVQNKIHSVIKNFFIFLIYCLLSICLINTQENIQSFGIIFSVICIPLAFLNLANIIFREDINDGTIELLLISFSAEEIIISKYIALCFNCFLSFGLNIPVIYFLFNISYLYLLIVFLCSATLILLSASLIIFISAIESYFNSNNNFLSILIMPLITPNIILSGILINNLPLNWNIFFIMTGINLVLIPLSLYLASYLTKNIYNI